MNQTKNAICGAAVPHTWVILILRNIYINAVLLGRKDNQTR